MKKHIISLSVLFAATTAFAGTANETYLELGVGYANFRRNGDSAADANVWRGVFNYALAQDEPVLIADVRTTLEYANDYSKGDDYFIGNVEAVLGAKVLSILKPYAFVGPELQNYHGFRALGSEYANDDWRLGLTWGAAVEVEVIPGFLHLTPYARFSNVDKLERNRYGFDLSVWFSYFGIGADFNYQDFRGQADAEAWQASIYAGVRF